MPSSSQGSLTGASHSDLHELPPGLYRWTARHPSWEPGAGAESAGDWPELVGCVAVDLGNEVVFVDPLVPEALWPRLDELVAGRPVSALTTVASHRRSAKAVLDRYRGTSDPPGGVLPFDVPAREREYWLPAFGALVVGDRVIADGRGGLRICPASWLRGGARPVSVADVAGGLRPLLELPIELVLVSHGDPVLRGGRESLARALRDPGHAS
jgi:hypothetical protein